MKAWKKKKKKRGGEAIMNGGIWLTFTGQWVNKKENGIGIRAAQQR